VAKLCDVAPDGTSMILAEGIIRARYREGFDAARPIEPGRVYDYGIDLVATSNVFLAGHRIRVAVTSSSFPRFDRNTGTGRPIGADTADDLVVARQLVFHDAQRASHIALVVVGEAV
jgi:putative CocE/NonD family hydrolase